MDSQPAGSPPAGGVGAPPTEASALHASSTTSLAWCRPEAAGWQASQPMTPVVMSRVGARWGWWAPTCTPEVAPVVEVGGAALTPAVPWQLVQERAAFRSTVPFTCTAGS